MSLTLAIGIYVVCWWVILFAVLPIGIRTQQEEGVVSPGTAESAPADPNLRFKFLLTTALAAVVFSIIYVVMAYDLISLSDVPFLPKYEPVT